MTVDYRLSGSCAAPDHFGSSVSLSLLIGWMLACNTAVAQLSTSPSGELPISAHDVVAIQHEPEDPAGGRYDWSPSVMRDGDLYRMWWVRLGGRQRARAAYTATLPDGEQFQFTYPDWGDRIYYAESRDGRRWRISGKDFEGPADRYGPDSDGPLMVLAPAESEHERYHVASPSVIRVDGTFYLYYEAPCEFAVSRGADGRPVVGNEYHNQVFVAVSQDGRRWRKHPDDVHPKPIVPAPEQNKQPGRRRYGCGQPSVFHQRGRFVMHYVDSCTGPGDFIVRIEADNPLFANAHPVGRTLLPTGDSAGGAPAGAIARFAQTDVKFLGDNSYLVRPVYETGNLNLLASQSGVFAADADRRHPREVWPQIRFPDPRGEDYRERIFPRFLTDARGQILVDNGRILIFCGSGRTGKTHAYTWDLLRAEVLLADLPRD